jgi:hypothetical protein
MMGWGMLLQPFSFLEIRKALVDTYLGIVSSFLIAEFLNERRCDAAESRRD